MESGASGRRSGSPGTRSSHVIAAPNTALSIGFSKRFSQPHIPSATSPLVRQNYVSSGMQTDAGGINDWYELTVPHNPRTGRYVSLTKRLLLRCQKDRERLAAASDAACDTNEKPDHGISSTPSGESREHNMLEIIDAAPVNTTEDSEMKDIKHDPGSEPGSVPSNIPVQKPRPPDQIPDNPDSMTGTEIKPPPLWPSQTAQSSPAHHGHINGYHSTELRVQLPPTPQIPHESASESSNVLAPNPALARSPSTQTLNSHPPTFPANSSSLVHPSPVKKKVSLVDYLNRLSNSKAESQSTSDKNASASLVLHQTPPKVLAGLEGGPKVLATEGSAIVDTPMKEAGDPLTDGKNSKL